MADARYSWQMLCVTSLGVLLVMMNLSTLNVALPALTTHFQSTPIESSWILLSYMLFNTVFILVFGKLSDLYSRKKLYLIGLSSFTVCSILCGFAFEVWILIVLRILQGVSGALIITNTTPMITEAFHNKDLGTALGINVLVSSTAQLLGPVIGGYLIYAFNWRWIFWFNIPIGIFGIILGFLILKDTTKQEKKQSFDILGSVCILLGLGGLIYAVSSLTSIDSSQIIVIIGFLSFIVFGGLLWWVEKKSLVPIIDFSMFSSKVFALSNLATFLNSVARSSVVLLMALFFQLIGNHNPFIAGLLILPLTAGTIIASLFIGKLSKCFTTVILTTSGLILSTVGLSILIINMKLEFSILALMIGQLLIGFGSGIFMTPNTKLIMLSTPHGSRGAANGLRSMLQNMGSVISTAVSLMLVASAVPIYLRTEIYSGDAVNVQSVELLYIVNGFQLAFLTMLIVTILATITVSFTKQSKWLYSKKAS